MTIPLMLAAAMAIVAIFPKLFGRTRAGDPIFSEADEPATLRAIRVGAGGACLLLLALIYLNTKN